MISAAAAGQKLLVAGGDTPTWGGPAGPDDGGAGGTGGGGGTWWDRRRGGTGGTGGSGGLASVTVTHPPKIKLHALIRGGLLVKISASGKVEAGIVLALDKGTAKRLGIGKKAVDS